MPEQPRTEQAIGPELGAEHYREMMQVRLADLPPNLRSTALHKMVDPAAPDIVKDATEGMRAYQRTIAVKWPERLDERGISKLYEARGIREEDAARFMDRAIKTTDWAHEVAHRIGLPPADVLQAREVQETLRSVQWGAGHPDADDGRPIDYAGRERASEVTQAFASKGPAHASLASLIRDLEVPIGLDGRFSMHPHYVWNEHRPNWLSSAGINRDDPGAYMFPEPAAEISLSGSEPAPASPPPTMIREDHASVAPSTDRVYLAVPFDEKDDVKALGGKWDSGKKAWFAPPGADLEAFAAWMPAKGEVHIATAADPREQFADAVRSAGLRPDGAPQMDGQLHRVPVEGDKGRERSGAYRAHLDGRPAGWFQNYRTGQPATMWKANGPAVALGVQERAQLIADAAQRRIDQARDREQQYDRTSNRVNAIWAAATPTAAHPYLAEKSVGAYGVRQAAPGTKIPITGKDGTETDLDISGRLLVPLSDRAGKLWSLQIIDANKENEAAKMFLRGGKVSGNHHTIGDEGVDGPIIIAEGYATAATVHEITELPTVVAFNAGNLAAVAKALREAYPDRAIYIAGDDDHEKSPNVGRKKAEAAAKEVGGQTILPPFGIADRGLTDWNDYANARGRIMATRSFRAGLAIAEREDSLNRAAAHDIAHEPRAMSVIQLQTVRREAAEIDAGR